MALLGLKQLDSPLTGSLKVSGSSQITGSLYVSSSMLANDAEITDTLTAGGHLYISDSIVHSADTNTKIRFPEADTITFHTSGNERLRIDVNGNISSSGEITGSGIYSDGPISILDSGPSTPNAKILINSSNNNLNIGDTIVVNDGNNRVGMGDTAPSSPDTELHIKSDNPVITLQRTDNEDKGAIEFQGQGGSVGAHIEYVSETNDLSFGTFDGSNVVERLRLVDGTNANIKVSGSTQITGSLYVSSSIYGDGSNLTGITSGIFQKTGSVQATTNDLQITGSLRVGTINATAIHTTNLTSSIITSSIVETSGSNIFGDTISDTHTFRGHITASNHISSSANITGSDIYSSGKFYGDGSELSGITSGIFQPTGSIMSTTNTLQITGSVVVSGSTLTVRTGTDSGPITASTAIFTNNIQNGYPTSNAWGEGLEGSYFNNFDNTSHVSEILRFMAGIISHSIDTSSPTANTKTFASVDTNNNNLGSTASQIAGRLPQNYTSLSNATLNYLVHKGWTSVGAKVFDGISIYNNSSYFVDFDSNSGGSTSVNSSADSELFGLGGLTNGAATQFDVRVIATQSFSDNATNSSPNQSSNTFTTQSNIDYTKTDFGTTSGVTLAKIDSANPAVIPAAFQDGKFENVGGTALTGSLTRKYHASKTDFSSVSSSGYYNFHDLKVGIATGSGNFAFVNGTDRKYFYAPRGTINTAIGSNSLADVGTTTRYLTCVSRSLSGAPYVTGSTYEISTKITGLFNPLYAGTTTLTDMNPGSVGVGSTSITNDNISTSGGTIQTANAIYDSTGASARGTTTVPYYNDIAIVSASVDWDAGNDDNIQQSSTFTDETFTVTVRARDRDSDYSTLDTQTLYYHTSSYFRAPLASGSMAVYGREQGYDGGALTGTTETFTGEDFRIKLLDNVQAFNGTAWTTTFELGQLGDYDLQVKPGFLVDPGGSYRYWHPSGYGATYQYYIRRFQTDGGTKTSMTVNLNNTTLVAWNSTSNGIACALLFESSGNGSGNNSSLSTARIYDPTATTSNLIEADIAQDNHKNPFSTAISLYGNSGGSIASGTYTVPIRNADGMYLDSNDNELYVIVRYKGDPTPIDDITLTFS